MLRINKRLLQIRVVGGWSFNTTYINSTAGGYTNILADQTTCFANLNFRIDTAITSGTQTLVSGLPLPKTRQTISAVIGSTAIRVYISEQGELKNDGNIPTGWANINVTYPLK